MNEGSQGHHVWPVWLNRGKWELTHRLGVGDGGEAPFPRISPILLPSWMELRLKVS